MRFVLRCLCIGMFAALLVACGTSEDETATSPLAYVPADTPFLYANLEPLDAATLDTMGMSELIASPAHYARQLEQLIELLQEDDHDADSPLIQGLRHTADYLNTHDYAQIMDDSGMDKDGLYALYGLGLSPVLRGDIDDADKFEEWLHAFEDAFDFQLTATELDGTDYSYASLLDDHWRFIVSTHGGQFVMAVIPTQDEARLRTVLAVDDADVDTMQETGIIDNLMTKYGYTRQLLAYADFTQLPALLAGADQDAMLKALAAFDTAFGDDLALLADPSCKVDFDRIAARAPQMSAGYTKLDDTVQESEFNLVLADDIIDAWRGAGKSVPGIGKREADSLADLALAMPVDTVREFALAQTRAIEATPFVCKALAPLNRNVAKAELQLARLGLPPFADMQGVRVVVDAAPLPLHSESELDMRALRQTRLGAMLALKDPKRVLSMAGALLPMVATLELEDDGKVRPLPQDWTALLGNLKAWMGMNDKALGVSMGEGEDERLEHMLNAGESKGDTVAHLYMQAQLYADALQSIIHLAEENGKLEQIDVDTLTATMRVLEHIEDFSITVGITADGLAVHNTIERPETP